MKQNKLEALQCLLRMARQSKKNKEDIVEMPCIHGNENSKMSLEDKMKVWK